MAKTFGWRLRQARKKSGKTQSDVARLFGITREAVALWETDRAKPEADKLFRLARYLRTSVDHLLSDRPNVKVVEIEVPGVGRSDKTLADNVANGPGIVRYVPLISWVKAGEFEEAVDTLQPGEAIDWLPNPRRSGPRTYALRVEGDSMTSPFGRSYPAGCIIFVDPDLRTPANGQRVIAKLEGTDHVTFKQYVLEAGRAFLKPLNPQYPPIHDPFKVIGTVIGKWEEE